MLAPWFTEECRGAEALSWLSNLDKRYNLTNPNYGIGDFIEDLKTKGYLTEEGFLLVWKRVIETATFKKILRRTDRHHFHHIQTTSPVDTGFDQRATDATSLELMSTLPCLLGFVGALSSTCLTTPACTAYSISFFPSFLTSFFLSFLP